MVFVSVSQDDPPHIRELDAVTGKLLSQSIRRLTGFGANIDQSERLFSDQIDVDVTDIERRRYREGDYLHSAMPIGYEGKGAGTNL